MRVILNVDAESENLYDQVAEAAHQYLKDENRLMNIRRYLQALRHTEFIFNEEITKVRYIRQIYNPTLYLYLVSVCVLFLFFVLHTQLFYILFFSFLYRSSKMILWRCEVPTKI